MGANAVVLGGGNMAEAIVVGAIEGGATRGDDWWVVDPSEERRARFEAWGVRTGDDAGAALRGAEEGAQLWLAVKPQVFAEIGPGLAGGGDGGRGGGIGERAVVSIMAGTTIASIRAALGGGVRPIRVMPNTPVRVRMGVSAIAPGDGATAADTAFARTVFGAIGTVVELPESLIDAFTGVAGSGPAYLFYVAEALVRGAEEAGLSEEDAHAIVPALIRGSAELLATSGRTAADLRRAVTSPGGTTAAGLAALEEGGVGEAFVRAVLAARDRGRALGGGESGG